MTGLETAEYLTTNYEGNKVSVLEMTEALAPTYRRLSLGLVSKLKKAGVTLCAGHRVLSLQDHELVCITEEEKRESPLTQWFSLWALRQRRFRMSSLRT
ncbi:MAG: hypothetical protein ACOX4A_08130 [Saccharofermentanales bacterium]